MFLDVTRDELARVLPDARCCKMAELSAFARMTGRFAQRAEKARGSGARALLGAGAGRRRSEDRGPSFEMATESAASARKVVTLMRELFDVKAEVEAGRRKGAGPGNLYSVRLPRDEKTDQALADLGVVSRKTLDATIREGVPWGLVSRRCCRRAYLRGAFLARGYVQNPERAYHMELVTEAETHARGMTRLARSFGVAARMSARKRRFVLYVKGAEDVVQFLRVVGANASVIALESVRVMRAMRGEVNRVVNCETANLSKTIDAGITQMEAIRGVLANPGIDSLPSGLREIARLRLEHPEASLKELGEMLVPPITKSAANHRMRRLVHMARRVGRTEHR